ncbi:MAG: V-type ATP synthase subunit F [Pirellulaceae bacterium]
MKFYCIGDEDTVRGFRLAGIDGQVVLTDQEAEEALRSVAGRADVGVVIINDVIAAGIREEVDAFRLDREQPLLVEIPGPRGPLPGRKTLRQLVHEAVGIRISQE